MVLLRDILSFVLAAAMLIAALPILLVAMWLVKRESPGPAIFAQTRVGRFGVPFTCYKVRTMYANTPDVPTHEMTADGVTRVGRSLRRLRIDEIPQLWNVLRNDMRLVGPRPCLPKQTELIAARKALGVDQLYPGITGISQALHIDMSVPDKLAKMDATYIGHVNPLTDLKIMAMTAVGMLALPDFVKKRD
jgi:O-antigen biosynthesis protein WbqP